MATTTTAQTTQQDRVQVSKKEGRLDIARGLRRLLIYVVLAFFSLFVLIPFAYMFSTSLKPESQLFIWPIRWVPDPIMWQNYIQAFVELSSIAPGLTFWRIL